MILKKRYRILTAVCALMLIASIALAVVGFARPVSVDAYISSDLKSTYSLNEIVDFSGVKINVDGTDKDATKQTLVYPNGVAYSNSEYLLDQVGRYTLTCYYNSYSASKTFDVFESQYKVSSSLSSATYVENYALPMSKSWQVDGGWTGEVYLPETPNKINGVKVSLAEGDKLQFNKPIKLKDGLNSIVNLFPLHDAMYGTGEYKRVVDRIALTITDCYDADKYVTFIFCFGKDNNYGNPYLRAKANGQRDGGIEMSNVFTGTISEKNALFREEIFINDTRYKIEFGKYGTYVSNVRIRENDKNYYYNGKLTQTGYEFLFDTDTNEVYSSFDATYNNGNKGYKLVNQLANVSKYGENIFSGFTTDEVYLSIAGEGYLGGDNLNFIVNGINGLTEDNIKDQGDDSLYKDNVAPRFEFSIPESVVVAKNSIVPVFDYKCYDANLKDVKVSLYYNYGSEYQSSVAIKNGKFKAELAGAYTLVYTGTDSYGNVGVSKIIISTVDKANGRVIDFKVDKIEGIVLGKPFELADATDLYSPNGQVNCTKKLEYFDGTGYKLIELDDHIATVSDHGRYRITYTFTDGITSYDYYYELNSVANDTIAFVGEPVLPSYFMKGYEYTLEDYLAYKFTANGKVAQSTAVEMKADGGEYIAIDNKKVKIEANSKVQFRYAAGGTSVESKEVKVVDCGRYENLNRAEYFQGENFNSAYNANEKRVELTTTTNGATVEFVNALSINAFALEFGVLPEQKDFEKLSFILTDYFDENNKIVISYYQKLVGGQIRYCFASQNRELEIANFYDGNRKLSFFGGDSVRDKDISVISIADQLKKFTGDKIRLSINVEGVSGQAGIYISSVNGQFLNALVINTPFVQSFDYNGNYTKGEKLTINAASVTDVLTTVLMEKVKLTVTAPSGNAVKSVDGVELKDCLANRDYEIELSEYGKYTITFKATNTAGEQINRKFIAVSVDTVRPTLTFDGEFDASVIQKATLNDTVNIAGFTVSDDVSESSEIVVAIRVLTPQSQIVELTEGNTFVADRLGYYTVIYQVEDVAGNVNLVEYMILVEKPVEEEE